MPIWNNRLRHCLQGQHPLWGMDIALAAPIPIHFPANTPREVVEDGPIIGPFTHPGELDEILL